MLLTRCFTIYSEAYQHLRSYRSLSFCGLLLQSLNISLNSSLSNCAYDVLCDYSQGNLGIGIIRQNDCGCSSGQEVVDACTGLSTCCDNDITPPVLNCPTNITDIEVKPDGTATAVFANFNITATDNCDTQVDITEFDINFDCSHMSNTWYHPVTATDNNGNNSMCQFGFKIIDPNGYCDCSNDTTPPTLNCSTNIPDIEIQPDGKAVTQLSDFGITVTDNCDNQLDLSNASFNMNCNQLGLWNFNLVATDDDGNSSQCPLQFRIVDPNGYCDCSNDTTPPTSNCSSIGSLDVNIQPDGTASASLADFNITVSDNCDNNVSIPNFTQNLDCTNVGIPRYRNIVATDSGGNSSSCIVEIKIFDPNNYCCADTYEYTGPIDIPNNTDKRVNDWILVNGAAGLVQLIGNSNAEMRAGNYIEIQPNFDVNLGSTLLLEIEPCN